MEGQPAWWKEVEEEKGGPEQEEEEEGEVGARHDVRALGASCSRSGSHAAYPSLFGPGRTEGPREEEEEGEEACYRQGGNEGDPKAQHRRVARG